MKRHAADDPEVLPRLGQPGWGDTTLFAPLDHETAPVASTTPQSLGAKFAAWRVTQDGVRAFEAIDQLAREQYQANTQRIGVKELVESVRKSTHIHINNSYTSLIARDLVDLYPEYRDLIELRPRNAA